MDIGRKRKCNDYDASERESICHPIPDSTIHRDLFAHYYSSITTLREHVLASLPQASRLRRKKISSLRSGPDCGELEAQLASLLDAAIVCTDTANASHDEVRWAQWKAFTSTQRHDDSTVTISGGLSDSHFCQTEVVDFVIWLLFQREKIGSRPKHLLCDGFRKTHREQDGTTSNIQGTFSLYRNSQVSILKQKPWPELLKLLGQSGERIMINLLLDCSLFIPIQAGFQNYYQLSGLRPCQQRNTLDSNHLRRTPNLRAGKTHERIQYGLQ